MRSGIENLCFRLRPHERVRTSSVFVLPYRRGQNEGHNAFRRAVLAALGGKAGDTAPLSVSFWGGDASAYMCEAIKKIVGAGIGADHVWIDAGWHGGSDAACQGRVYGQMVQANGGLARQYRYSSRRAAKRIRSRAAELALVYPSVRAGAGAQLRPRGGAASRMVFADGRGRFPQPPAAGRPGRRLLPSLECCANGSGNWG